ncbi:MAG TPA: prephenate dehydrogenase/arogenate dehydrogenase family protein [Anaerolineales bacterium]
MEDGFRLQDSKIAIIGLGLMGGSLALALKGKCAAVYGIDPHPATLELAVDKKIVDSADSDPAKFLPQAELVILATPVPTIISLIQKLPSLTNRPCIVLDLGSTKSRIMSAMDTLPAHFDVVGGHPICGKENLGIENADALLYQNAPFVITPLKRTTLRARTAIKNIITVIGAHLIEMNAEDHDRALAFASHLPFLVSSALALTVPHENARLIGSGFRSTARLAGTPGSMMLGVIQSNRENILKALHHYQHQLSLLELALLSSDEAALESILSSAQSRYHGLVD